MLLMRDFIATPRHLHLSRDLTLIATIATHVNHALNQPRTSGAADDAWTSSLERRLLSSRSLTVLSAANKVQRPATLHTSRVAATMAAVTNSSDGATCVQDGGSSVAVVGAGIAGAVVARKLADLGCKVTIFDLGRGPGGRMSQRREKIQLPPCSSDATQSNGSEGCQELQLKFDHGAQYFSAGSPVVSSFLEPYMESGLVQEWAGSFGTWDTKSTSFQPDLQPKSRLVCCPGMNSICQKVLSHPNITTAFSTHVTGLNWLGDQSKWEVETASGSSFGPFDAAAIAAAYRTMGVSINVPAEWRSPEVSDFQSRIAGVPAEPCFALMLAFERPLREVPFDGAKVSGCSTISWVAKDSSKPGRGSSAGLNSVAETWVIHSTAQYAREVVAKAPPGRPSPELLAQVASDMQSSFRALFLGQVSTEEPLFVKVHRWGGAFPSEARAPEGSTFLSASPLPLVGCGDFCLSPRVESALESALDAAEFLAARLLREGPRL